jgi:hypothetical protein
MGFSIINKDQVKTNFIGTFNGEFEIKCTPETEGVKSRVNKNGKTIHAVTTRSLSGFITDADKYTNTYGSYLRLFLTRDGEEYRLNLPWKGNMAGCFLACMENIDFTKSLQIDISTYNDRQYLFFKQNGNRVPAKYTKAEPNGRPEWQVEETEDGKRWNNNAERAFYQTILEETIRPLLSDFVTKLMREDDPVAIVDEAEKVFSMKDVATIKNGDVAPDDDLPF